MGRVAEAGLCKRWVDVGREAGSCERWMDTCLIVLSKDLVKLASTVSS